MHRIIALALLLAIGSVSAEASRSWQQFDSLTSVIAKSRLLLGVMNINRRMVAVGAFGHILISDDGGKAWRQAKTPVSQTLTSVHFPSKNIGFAVGHDNVILKTEDGGESWRLIHIDPDITDFSQLTKAFSDEPSNCGGAQEKDNCLIPLLAVYFRDDNNGLVVGAFGQALSTSDGGENWKWRPFPRALVKDEFQDPNDPDDDYIEEKAHLNGITQTANGNLYVAAEYGTVFRSADGGKSFRSITTGYGGSFWGVLPIANSVLAYGMRGNIWRTDNNGRSWRKLDTGGARQSFQGGTRFVRGLANGNIVLTGLNGIIAISKDGGRSFKACTRPERKGYAAITEGDNGDILLFGKSGIFMTKLNAPCK